MARLKPTRYANSAMVRYVRSLDGEFYLPREAAVMLNVAPTLLDYLVNAYPGQGLGPTHQAGYGSLMLRLYTPERIERIRQHLETVQGDGKRAGQRPIFTPAETYTRRRLGQRMRNYSSRARTAREAGWDEEADRLDGLAAQLRQELDRTREEALQRAANR